MAASTTKTYSADGLNQYTSVGGTSQSHDDRGDLTDDGSTTYGYDADNRLVSASGGVSLSYDPAGRLHEVSGGSTTRFLGACPRAGPSVRTRGTAPTSSRR